MGRRLLGADAAANRGTAGGLLLLDGCPAVGGRRARPPRPPRRRSLTSLNPSCCAGTLRLALPAGAALGAPAGTARRVPMPGTAARTLLEQQRPRGDCRDCPAARRHCTWGVLLLGCALASDAAAANNGSLRITQHGSGGMRCRRAAPARQPCETQRSPSPCWARLHLPIPPSPFTSPFDSLTPPPIHPLPRYATLLDTAIGHTAPALRSSTEPPTSSNPPSPPLSPSPFSAHSGPVQPADAPPWPRPTTTSSSFC